MHRFINAHDWCGDLGRDQSTSTKPPHGWVDAAEGTSMNMSAPARSEFERLVESVSQRIESSEHESTDIGREALAVAIVQEIAAFVLEWAEGSGEPR